MSNKLNRSQLRRLILKEIKNLSEAGSWGHRGPNPSELFYKQWGDSYSWNAVMPSSIQYVFRNSGMSKEEFLKTAKPFQLPKIKDALGMTISSGSESGMLKLPSIEPDAEFGSDYDEDLGNDW